VEDKWAKRVCVREGRYVREKKGVGEGRKAKRKEGGSVERIDV
jgi:hypothetical protein